MSREEVEDVFRNVVHVPSDSRHIDVLLWMVREARRRRILVSVDCEKDWDRNSVALDELIGVYYILFTNSNHLSDYLGQLTREREAVDGVGPLPDPTVVVLGDGGGSDGEGDRTTLSLDA